MLKEIGPDDRGRTLDLLKEGFPERSHSFWERSIERLLAWPGNELACYPPGFFWTTKNEMTGIVLTPASTRIGKAGMRDVIVNVSCWYVRDAYRWQAPLMLRALFNNDKAIFTDLTPTPAVQKMLPAFKFQSINTGIEWINLPREALRSTKLSVRPWHMGETLAEGAPPDSLIKHHQDLGCEALVIEAEELRHLVVLRRMTARGLPAASVLFASSNSALQAALPALARHLLRRGSVVLRIDARPEGQRGRGYRTHGIWFARGNTFDDRTDHFGSELVLFDL